MGLGAAGGEAGVTIVVTVPFTFAFCFLDDVGTGRRSSGAPGYRLRTASPPWQYDSERDDPRARLDSFAKEGND
jgi:hypothetical protein